MPKVSIEAIRQVEAALDQYEEQVETTNLKPSSKWTYILHARQCVRWLNADFEPGINLRRRISLR